LKNEGLDVLFHPLDVTDEESIGQLVRWLEEEHGHLEVLVNNAGISVDAKSSVFELPPTVLQRTLETNFYGPLFLTQALLPLMQRRRYGRIIHVSSGMGQLSSMGQGDPAYRISKAALNALTLIMAAELRGTNILVNAMCPGWVRTEMGGDSAERSVEEGADTVLWLAALPKDGPQGGFFRDRKAIPW